MAAIASDDLTRIREIFPEHVKYRTVHAHMPALEVRELLPDLWPRAFKFVVERHPYEKAVSLTWWKISEQARRSRSTSLLQNEEFPEVLESVIDGKQYMNYSIYTIDNDVAVDEIIPYDRLWERMRELAQKYGKSIPTNLPHANGDRRLDRRPAIEVLSDRQKEKIYNDARVEFDLLGFKP